LALQVEKLVVTNINGVEQKNLYKSWERSNKPNLIFIKISIANNIVSSLYKTESANKFTIIIEKCSQTIDKSLVRALMSTLTIMKLDNSHTMHECIKMTNITAGLKLHENFLVLFIINSLPHDYGLH